MITRVTSPLVTAETPASTPEAMLPAEPVILSWSPWSPESICALETKLLSCTQSWSFCRPSLALFAISPL